MKIRRKRSPLPGTALVMVPAASAAAVKSPLPSEAEDGMLDEHVAKFVDALVDLAVTQWLAR
jgi:hypothetical protein